MKIKLFCFLGLAFASLVHAEEKGKPCDPGDGANGAEIPLQLQLTTPAANFDCRNDGPGTNTLFPNVRRIELADGGVVPMYEKTYDQFDATTGVFRFGLHIKSMQHGQVRNIMQVKTLDPKTGLRGDAHILIQEVSAGVERHLKIWLHLVEKNGSTTGVVQDLPLGSIRFIGNELASELDYRFKIRLASNAGGHSVFALDCLRAGPGCQFDNVSPTGPVTTKIIAQKEAFFRFDSIDTTLNSLDPSPKLVVKLVW